MLSGFCLRLLSGNEISRTLSGSEVMRIFLFLAGSDGGFNFAGVCRCLRHGRNCRIAFVRLVCL